MCAFAAKGRGVGGGSEEEERKQISNLRFARSDQCQSSFTNGFSFFRMISNISPPHLQLDWFVSECAFIYSVLLYWTQLIFEHIIKCSASIVRYVFSTTWYLVILFASSSSSSSSLSYSHSLWLWRIYSLVHIFPRLYVSSIFHMDEFASSTYT